MRFFAVLMLCGGMAHAEVPIVFTGTEPFAPKVHVERGGQKLWLVLDTGHTEARKDVVNPMLFVQPGEALVMDFIGGVMFSLPWNQAIDFVNMLPRALVNTGLLRRRAHVSGVADGLFVDLVIDTASPVSQCRGQRARLVVNGFELAPRHTGAPPEGADGVLGMDLLRRCVMALDSARMLVRCADDL
jgi:hypothetical protein